MSAMEDLSEIRALLVDALGGEDAIPDHASTVHLAHAVKSQMGGYRAGIDSASRVCGKWADQLTEAMDEFDITEFRVVGVRDALRCHSGREVNA